MVHPRGGARQELPGGLGEDGAPTFRSPQEAASAAAAQGIPGRGLRPAQREPAVSGLQTSHRWGCCILMGFFNLKEPGRSPADISCSCVGERSMMYSVRDEGWAGGPKGVGPGVQGGLVSGRGAFLSSSLPPPVLSSSPRGWETPDKLPAQGCPSSSLGVPRVLLEVPRVLDSGKVFPNPPPHSGTKAALGDDSGGGEAVHVTTPAAAGVRCALCGDRGEEVRERFLERWDCSGGWHPRTGLTTSLMESGIPL